MTDFSGELVENPKMEQIDRLCSAFYGGFVKKLSIYTHFSVFFVAVTCQGIRKIYICIEFG